ncbi:hypothetical protein ACFYO1_06745 [Nocardia sp. NPDC006044]|uniref:hypothetical protein n=1 Tax=Nocardia sp. NPDC006044 TaxID=3364306 RepID=UPI003681AC1F
MLLDHLGEHPAAEAVDRAVCDVLAAGEVLTPDPGGTAAVTDFAAAVAPRAAELAEQ